MATAIKKYPPVYGDVTTGVINGVNRIFTSTVNFKADKNEYFSNNIRLTKDTDYTVTGDNQITLSWAPEIEKERPIGNFIKN